MPMKNPPHPGEIIRDLYQVTPFADHSPISCPQALEGRSQPQSSQR